MQLALRKTAASGANLMARLAAVLIKIRLVSEYCHGGIVVGDRLYHATAAHGLCESTIDHSKWDLFDLGTAKDLEVSNLFQLMKGTQYDWFSLLAFILPWRVSDAKRMYCFEWCWIAMTRENPSGRITPEMLLHKTITIREENDRTKTA